MRLKIIFAIFAFTIAVLFVYSQTKKNSFAPAEDFPREVLIYVQIADLPSMIRLWNESALKENYLISENFKEFSNRHLGRKLASRWREFNDAAGFSFDLETIAKLAANRASLAVYDVGKLEFVFIAPISDELFAATKFAEMRGTFSEETLDDGTAFYRKNVEADRGRQKQELIFAQIKGRFVLTTSEKLLNQTLSNISGTKAKNRLSDEPLFKAVSEKIEPHAATVWVNQTALNDDYYFKRYWLMSDVSELKNIRAGMFDFEIAEGKIIERRKFLLDKTIESAPISKEQINGLKKLLPDDIPFYRLESIQPEKINRAIGKTIFFRQTKEPEKSRRYSRTYFSIDDYYYFSGSDYYSLSSDFDEKIDENDDDESVIESETKIDFSEVFQSANPQAILTFGQPELSNAPLFAEFNQAAVFYLASEKSFDRTTFEAAVLQKFSEQTTIGKSKSELKWETKNEEDLSRRELDFPILNLNVSYSVKDNLLILTNNSAFLKKILQTKKEAVDETENFQFNALTSLNLEERENAYDKIFGEIKNQKLDEVFFTGNIQSLLETISGVKKIEIREVYNRNFFEEEIIFTLK